jgi:hypothetical protein
VAHRKDRRNHVQFFRPCKRCGEPFEFCGACEPGRLYCGDACSKAAREESVRQARDKYNDRGSEEGREAHRIEEADRRERRRVGDQRRREQAGRVEMLAAAAYRAAEEASNEVSVPFASPLAPSLPSLGDPRGANDRAASATTAPTEWVLVAWPELLAQAQQRLGTEASCRFCSRRGQIVRVISIEEWRREVRRGFG